MARASEEIFLYTVLLPEVVIIGRGGARKRWHATSIGTTSRDKREALEKGSEAHVRVGETSKERGRGQRTREWMRDFEKEGEVPKVPKRLTLRHGRGAEGAHS